MSDPGPKPALPPQLRTQAALAVDQFFAVLGISVVNHTAHAALTDAMGRLMATSFSAGVEYGRRLGIDPTATTEAANA
jgi:hypothetical protein